MDKILITGVNGFVGAALAGALCSQKGLKITGLDRDKTLRGGQACSRVTYQCADLGNNSAIETITNCEPDVIIHLAGLLTKSDDTPSHLQQMDANVVGTLHVLEAARANRCKVVFASTGLVYGDQAGPFTEDMACKPIDFYGYSKFAAEELIRLFSRKYGCAHAILRAAVLYGPGQSGPMFIPSIIKALLNGEAFAMTKGEQTRDFVYIDDFTAALTLMATSRHEGTYNVGSAEAVTMKETAELVQKIIQTQGLVNAGAIPYRPNESWQYALCPDKLMKQTGWKPTVTLREGIKKTIDHQRIRSQKKAG